MAKECGKCRFERERTDWLYRDDTWAVGATVWTVQGPTPAIIPGMVTLQLRRHATVFELVPDEWASLGPLVGHVVHAVREATGAECVYWLALGEGVPHFHINFLPRGPDVPLDERGIDLWPNLVKYVDDDAIPAMSARVGTALKARTD